VRRPEFHWKEEHEETSSRGAWLFAAAVHSLLLFGWITGRPVDPVHYPERIITLAPFDAPGREVRMTFPANVPLRSRGVHTPTADIYSPPPPAPPKPLAERNIPPATPVATGRGRIGILGPGLGEGRLWVEPLPLSPRQLASVLTRQDAKAMADSFVTQIVQQYLDSIAHDPDVASLKPPSWVAEVNGKKFGIDASHIYIAGLKIPTALLALLPIPGANNQRPIDHNLEGMAYDLRVAGARARNIDEFRDAVRALRARNERDREFEKNRERAPSDTLVGHIDH
jgi:hypothetical protein